MNDELTVDVVESLADRLESAWSAHRPCAPVRDVLGEQDVVSAYAVQGVLTARRQARGARVVGRKIGLTASAVQRQLGVDRPDFGVLFADMDASFDAVIDIDAFIAPRIEAEVAFVLGADLDSPTLEMADVRAAVDYATAALEIVDSRIADWDIRLADTIADNASSGAFVLGDRHRELGDFEPRAVSMEMFEADRLVSTGDGAACLGDPLNALLWLARTMRDFDEPLRAGQVVLSGALGPMVDVSPGADFRAEISGLGSVRATFSERNAS